MLSFSPSFPSSLPPFVHACVRRVLPPLAFVCFFESLHPRAAHFFFLLAAAAAKSAVTPGCNRTRSPLHRNISAAATAATGQSSEEWGAGGGGNARAEGEEREKEVEVQEE